MEITNLTYMVAIIGLFLIGFLVAMQVIAERIKRIRNRPIILTEKPLNRNAASFPDVVGAFP